MADTDSTVRCTARRFDTFHFSQDGDVRKKDLEISLLNVTIMFHLWNEKLMCFSLRTVWKGRGCFWKHPLEKVPEDLVFQFFSPYMYCTYFP